MEQGGMRDETRAREREVVTQKCVQRVKWLTSWLSEKPEVSGTNRVKVEVCLTVGQEGAEQLAAGYEKFALRKALELVQGEKTKLSRVAFDVEGRMSRDCGHLVCRVSDRQHDCMIRSGGVLREYSTRNGDVNWAVYSCQCGEDCGERHSVTAAVAGGEEHEGEYSDRVLRCKK